MINMKSDKKILTAFLDGEIDQHNAEGIRKSIDIEVEKKQPYILRLDFSDVNFMDSSGIGLVMGRYREMDSRGGKLKVTNIPKHLERIFKLSGLMGPLGEVFE